MRFQPMGHVHNDQFSAAGLTAELVNSIQRTSIFIRCVPFSLDQLKQKIHDLFKVYAYKPTRTHWKLLVVLWSWLRYAFHQCSCKEIQSSVLLFSTMLSLPFVKLTLKHGEHHLDLKRSLALPLVTVFSWSFMIIKSSQLLQPIISLE